jgi:hypothetical protein
MGQNMLTMKRRLHLILGIILIFVALGALPAGFSMIRHPDGSGLGMTTDYLKNSPFKDFLVPGIFLFAVNGVLSLAGAVLCFLRSGYSSTIGMMLGLSLVVWICVQVWAIGLTSFMQPMFFIIGLAEIALSILIIRQKIIN